MSAVGGSVDTARPLTKRPDVVGGPIQTCAPRRVTPPFGGFVTTFHTDMDPINARTRTNGGLGLDFGSSRGLSVIRFVDAYRRCY